MANSNVDTRTGEVLAFEAPDDLPAPGTIVHESLYAVPSESEFRVQADGEATEVDFIVATKIHQLADALISQHSSFRHLKDHRILYRWARESLGKKHPASKTVIPNPDLQWAFQQYSGATIEVVVTLSAHECRRRAWGPIDVEELLFHELEYIEEDDSETDEEGRGKLLLMGHECHGSPGEIRRYGFRHARKLEDAGARYLQAAAKQLSLLEDDGQQPRKARGQAHSVTLKFPAEGG